MDPLVTSALVSAGGSFLGGLFGNNSAKKAAKAQMAFQERMAKNAHQYEVADLKAAGLNPILSAGGSGAATPSGAMPSLNPNVVGDAISSGFEASRLSHQLDNMDADTDLKRDSAAAARSQDFVNKKTAELISANIRQVGVNTKLLSNQLPSTTNQAEVESSWLGKGSAYVNKFSDTLGNFLGAFGNIIHGQK